MRTTLNIDDKLFEGLLRLTGARTKTEAVRIALTEYVRFKRKAELLSLKGRLDIADDWRELRELETQDGSDG